MSANEQVERVEEVIRDYIKIGLDFADTGTPTGLDPKTWEACVYQIRNLHLAEPWLPAFEAITAMTPTQVVDPGEQLLRDIFEAPTPDVGVLAEVRALIRHQREFNHNDCIDAELLESTLNKYEPTQ